MRPEDLVRFLSKPAKYVVGYHTMLLLSITISSNGSSITLTDFVLPGPDNARYLQIINLQPTLLEQISSSARSGT